MSTVFENIVPSLNLCKQIPADEFDDSTFVWCTELPYDPGHHSPKIVLPRSAATEDQIVAPAPTAEEILDKLIYELKSPTMTSCMDGYTVTGFDTALEDIQEKHEKLAEAALRLWLRLNGDDDEQDL